MTSRGRIALAGILRSRGRVAVIAFATVLAVACHSAGETPAAGPSPIRPPALAIGDTLRPLLLAAGRATIHAALATVNDSAAVCVAFTDSTHRTFRAEPADLVALAGPSNGDDTRRHRFVSIGDCPKTYASMIAYVDKSGRSLNPPRPPGYVDPHTVSIEAPTRWLPKADERSITVMVNVGQGTAGHTYLCRLRPSTAVAAIRHPTAGALADALADAATCRIETAWIH